MIGKITYHIQLLLLDVKDKELINNLKVPNFDIVFGEETVKELDLEWKNKLKENEMICPKCGSPDR